MAGMFKVGVEDRGRGETRGLGPGHDSEGTERETWRREREGQAGERGGGMTQGFPSPPGKLLSGL